MGIQVLRAASSQSTLYMPWPSDMKHRADEEGQEAWSVDFQALSFPLLTPRLLVLLLVSPVWISLVVTHTHTECREHTHKKYLRMELTIRYMISYRAVSDKHMNQPPADRQTAPAGLSFLHLSMDVNGSGWITQWLTEGLLNPVMFT